MHKLLTILAITITMGTYAQIDFFSKADRFFKTHVKNNRIDYSQIKTDPKELFELIDFISTNPIPENTKKAYLINAYNLLVISGIIEHYPVVSPQIIPAFFDGKNHVLNHQNISLNSLEQDYLFKTYQDPGLHFVLVCGAIGCPPLISKAYQPNNLDYQIKTQVTLALNSTFIKVNTAEKKVELSEIFRWYAKDFGNNTKAITTYINSFRTTKIPVDYKVSYYEYNWSLNDLKTYKKPEGTLTELAILPQNLQAFTPGSLLRKNQYDYTLFNTIYTETKSNWQGVNSSGFRNTFVTHLVQITYGITENSRVNIGLDINIKNSGTSVDSTLNGLKPAFSYQNGPSSRAGITSLGARIKLQPFKSESNFSIQSTLAMPTIKFPEGNGALYWADWDRMTWWNQFFYTKAFGDFQLFAEIDLLFRFKRYATQIGMLDIPTSVFLSYFPNNKITIYGMSQHVPRLTNNIHSLTTDWVIPANYTASGLGAKYQITRGLNIELLYTNFWRSTNSGQGSTFNLGIKYITK